MNPITRITNNIKIKKKLIFSYLFVVFIPVIMVGLLLTESLREMSVNHAVEQSENNVEKIKKNVEEILKIPTDVSTKIFFDKKLKTMVNTIYNSDLEVFRAYTDYTDFNDYLRLYGELSGVRFYSHNPTLLNNWTLFHADETVEKNFWYQDALKNRGRASWQLIPDPTQHDKPFLSLSREIFYDNNNTFCGILVVSVNPEHLQSIVSQEPYETIILSDKDEVVAAKDMSLTGKTLKELQMDTLLGSKELEIREVSFQGEDAKIIIQPLRPQGTVNSLRIVSIIPLKPLLAEERRISFIAFSIIFVSLLFSFVMIVFFSEALTKRIGTLIRDFRGVAMGDLTRTSVVQGMDEIGQLSRHFNAMVRSIEELMSKVEEAHEQKNALLLKQKEIKFKMLANQINPHFLFNVLETIRMEAHFRGEEKIANSVKSLGKLLRHNLEIGQDPAPLVTELHLVRTYLELQQMRFGDKLEYTLPKEEEVEGLVLLPLILQPIVENAIIHGIENKKGKGKVVVTLERETNQVRLMVSDNGGGIEASKWEKIKQALDENEDEQVHRIGLRNVHQRLKLYYGPEYGLEIQSIPGFGTTVTIHFRAGGVAHV